MRLCYEAIHKLVTTGRTELYATGRMLFVGAGLMGSNWIILSSACLAIAMTRFVAIPREERALVEKFGAAIVPT